jgi:anti-sigma B factor antagonist
MAIGGQVHFPIRVRRGRRFKLVWRRHLSAFGFPRASDQHMLREMPTVVEGELKDQTLYLVVKTTRLDAATARDFKSQCQQLWRPGIESVTIDLASVEFLDSSGVGALLSVYKHLPRETARVTLLHVTPPVQSVVELLRLHRILQIQN